MPKKITALDGGKTHDIIYYLAMAAPGAIAQAKKANLHEIIGLTGANVKKDAELAGKWIRSNVQYQIDNFDEQNIQFPSAILKTKKADCKSLSLLYLAIMTAAGYEGGFRFAAYRKNKQFTHVYNYFLDRNGKKLTFDACISNLKESPRHTNLKDMKVNYLAGAPVMLDDTINGPDEITRPVRKVQYRGIAGIEYLDNGEFISEAEFIGRKRLRDRIKGAWDKIKRNLPNPGKVWNAATKIPFTVPRQAFRLLVQLNVRGFASKLKRLLDKNPDSVKKLWERFGGDYTKLFDDIKRGEKKKPLFGVKGGKPKKGIRGINGVVYYQPAEYIGEPLTVAAALTAAVPIIAAVVKALKDNNIKDLPEEIPPPDDKDIPDLPDLPPDPTEKGKTLPSDPEGDEATAYVKSGGQVYVNTKGEVVTQGPGAGGILNSKNLLIFGGIAAVAAILLLKKRK